MLRGSIVNPNGSVLQGEVVIESDKITCVAADCPDPPGASVFTISDAFVFPGFIDAHNHVAYNVLPQWAPPKLYLNRGQWQASTAYGAFKAPYPTLKDQKKLFCEMVKWGEIAALISGIKADITVVRQRGPEPGSSLLQNHLADVEMVWIGGQLHYGTASVVQTVRPDACENVVVQGSAKRLCIPVLPLVTTLGKQFPYLVPWCADDGPRREVTSYDRAAPQEVPFASRRIDQPSCFTCSRHPVSLRLCANIRSASDES